MNITINLTPFANFFTQPADIVMTQLLFYFGWIPIAIVFLWGSFELWIYYRQGQWAAKNAKFTILAIDVPRGNEQSPKAVENLFAYLSGAQNSSNLIEKYWEGKFQLSFSFEIISTGGYTQFLIRSPIIFRDLVESAVYAQYPDAEITEVDDYADAFKNVRFPNDKYDIMGAEFILSQPNAYPIKTYEEFEHMMGEPETHFKDPMAALMDLCSSLRPNENLWYQMILVPIGFDWVDKLDMEVAKILGEKPKFKKNLMHYGADAAMGAITGFHNVLMGPVESEGKKVEKKDETLKMMSLKPKQKKRVEGIEKKSGKVAFEFKIRFVYLAEKEVFNKAKVFSGFVGFMKQFAAIDSNNLKPDMDKTATSASYFFRTSHLNTKKNKILHNYIRRSATAGRKRGLLNVEELATVWHFPNEGVVKAPMIQKAPGRKSEPPMTLPQSDEMVSEEKAEPLFFGELQSEAEAENNSARPNLPDKTADATESDFTEDSGDESAAGIPADNFEPSFAKATDGKPDFTTPAPRAPKPPAAAQQRDENRGAPPENLPFA
jgi:hypothetical protein